MVCFSKEIQVWPLAFSMTSSSVSGKISWPSLGWKLYVGDLNSDLKKN